MKKHEKEGYKHLQSPSSRFVNLLRTQGKIEGNDESSLLHMYRAQISDAIDLRREYL